MQRVVSFLTDIVPNNNKPWFDANKARYKEAQAIFNEFASELLERVQGFDPEVRGLTLKDCTYRLYRDLRFSKDKTPYKTHFGIFIAKDGKCSGHSGYYFHIESPQAGYLGGNLMCCGAYAPEPKVMRSIREEFMLNGEALVNAMSKAKGFELEWDGALKKIPKGFPADSTYAEYFCLKKILITRYFDDAFLFKPDLAKRAADLFATCTEFNTILNRAIDFAYEEY
ncbi:MAG TPA: DUF2461 domain-containing protein [Bacteroidales bacterium]|nr:DUF2461 domain-containing protein [Bacteroidales bacterium]